jgi:uncharacterized membrane protein YhaH (DUF805 family)
MTSQVGKLLSFLSRLDEPVDRRTYALAGFSLAVIKYAGDATLFGVSMGHFWTPIDYLRITHSLLGDAFRDAPHWLIPALALWMLPFLWIGLALSLRRAIDAGLSPWFTLLFFCSLLQLRDDGSALLNGISLHR